MKMDGYIDYPPFNLFGYQLIDLTWSTTLLGFSWTPEVVWEGTNPQYVGDNIAGGCHLEVCTRDLDDAVFVHHVHRILYIYTREVPS
jgi:hypothetical protein